ncbi:toprim domain-containing protein [Paenibacillus sp. strain BS8-2]
MDVTIVVEGKNDRNRLKRVIDDRIQILCTYGTPGAAQLEKIRKDSGHRHVFVFTDNDSSGRRIRGMLSDIFPDAEHIYTRRGYSGVEHTPEEYLIEQLEKAGLGEYIMYPAPDPAPRWNKENF